MSVLWVPNLQIAPQRSPLQMRGKHKCEQEAGKTRRYEHPTTWPSFFPPPSPCLACHNVWRWIRKRLEATNLRTENRQKCRKQAQKAPVFGSSCHKQEWIPGGYQRGSQGSEPRGSYRCTTSDLLAGPACLWCLVRDFLRNLFFSKVILFPGKRIKIARLRPQALARHQNIKRVPKKIYTFLSDLTSVFFFFWQIFNGKWR
jgi:hypothetical protein